MAFQQTVNKELAQAVAGDFASMNPYSTVNAGESALVAGEDGVKIGYFAWVDPETGKVTNRKPENAKIRGFVIRNQQGSIVEYLADSTMTIQRGCMVTLANSGDFFVKIDGATKEDVNKIIYIDNVTGKPKIEYSDGFEISGFKVAEVYENGLVKITSNNIGLAN